MDARPWRSSANRYYAFSERLDLLDRISKTPPPPSTSSSRSPPSAIYTRKSAPTSPVFGPPASFKSSLLDRISPKVYPLKSRPTGDLSPLSPEPGDYLDAYLDEEEEEQVIRVLDNNRELVYQRDFGMDEYEEEPHESRNSSPVKKRKLAHPNQSTNKSTPQTSPTQIKPNQKAKRTRSHSHSPPRSRSNPASPPKKQPLASRLGVDWSSGSSGGGGSTFGKRSGLTFGFAGYGYDTSAEMNTTGRATLQDRIETTPLPEPPQDDLYDNTRGSDPPLTPAATQSQNGKARGPLAEVCRISGGTSLLRRIGSYRPISDLEAPRQGGEEHGPDHETDHEEGEENDAFVPPTPLPVLPPHLHMASPPQPRKSSSRTPNRENRPEQTVQPESVASSRPPLSPPGPRTPPRLEIAEEEIKSMEQHAEDLLQDIQKEFLAKVSPELGGIVPGLPAQSAASMSPHSLDRPLRASPSPILDGMSPLLKTRSISPLLDIDHHNINFDTLSISTHTPRSTADNLPDPIARSTSFPPSDPDPCDILLEVDPEIDQLTKQALGDLIVHSLKLNHDLSANEGWENSDAVRRAIKQEVDEHARDFLRLAAKLANRMDLMKEPREGTEVPGVEPDQPMAELNLPGATENGYLEDPPPIEGPEDKELPQHKGDAERIDSDVEMDSAVPVVPQSDPEEDRVELDDEPTGEQDLDDKSTNGRVGQADHVDHDEYADEGASQESGLEIPGVWCARTGKDRTDTIQEQIEVSEAVAARVRKWARGNSGSRE